MRLLFFHARVSFFLYFSRTRGSFLYVSSRHCQNRTQPLRTVTAKTDPDDCFFLVLFLFCSTFFSEKEGCSQFVSHWDFFFLILRAHVFTFFSFFVLNHICQLFTVSGGVREKVPTLLRTQFASVHLVSSDFCFVFSYFCFDRRQGWDTFSPSQFCIANWVCLFWKRMHNNRDAFFAF